MNAAISYVCRLHPKQGALLLEKCVEEGVPAGPFYGQLKAGKDVTLPCGKIVLADSVRTPDDPGPVFLIVDCPDESFLDNFIANEKLNKYRGSDSSETPEVVVHFTPIQVIISNLLEHSTILLNSQLNKRNRYVTFTTSKTVKKKKTILANETEFR